TIKHVLTLDPTLASIPFRAPDTEFALLFSYSSGCILLSLTLLLADLYAGLRTDYLWSIMQSLYLIAIVYPGASDMGYETRMEKII
ncbi:hypothetical protein KI387_005222, partial [Taxus chinensis]